MTIRVRTRSQLPMPPTVLSRARLRPQLHNFNHRENIQIPHRAQTVFDFPYSLSIDEHSPVLHEEGIRAPITLAWLRDAIEAMEKFECKGSNGNDHDGGDEEKKQEGLEIEAPHSTPLERMASSLDSLHELIFKEMGGLKCEDEEKVVVLGGDLAVGREVFGPGDHDDEKQLVILGHFADDNNLVDENAEEENQYRWIHATLVVVPTTILFMVMIGFVLDICEKTGKMFGGSTVADM